MLQRWALSVLICTVLTVLDISHRAPSPSVARASLLQFSKANADSALKSMGQGYIPMPAKVPAVHASHLLAMPKDHPWSVLAFWFAGSKEAAPDVRIAASYFDKAAGQWSSARFVLDRQDLERQLGFGVSRLGNPVAWLDGRGRIHLFVVATGMGGWAASRIVHLRQNMPSHHLAQMQFDVQRVLPLSWLWNYSYLVRASALPLQDGGMILPVYFELGKLVPVALRFDAEGVFKGLVRMSHQTHLLQPQIVPLTESHWLALMRNSSASRKVDAAYTMDAGENWQDMPELDQDNPDSSIAVLRLAPEMMVLAHNATTHSRSILDLSVSADGLHWRRALNLASSTEQQEYSYPSMTWADNSLWVSYTDQRKSIAWQRFAVTPQRK